MKKVKEIYYGMRYDAESNKMELIKYGSLAKPRKYKSRYKRVMNVEEAQIALLDKFALEALSAEMLAEVETELGDKKSNMFHVSFLFPKKTETVFGEKREIVFGVTVREAHKE